MTNLQGSWVAMPTPFTEDNKIDFQGFETLINRQIKYGTSQLFILGSAGEVTLLTQEEKKVYCKRSYFYDKGKNSGVLQCSFFHYRNECRVCSVL